MQKIRADIFKDITEEEFGEMLAAGCMRERRYRRNELIFRMGDVTHELGIVLDGSVLIENDDLWGNASILGRAGAGEIFAETYALCLRPMMVEVVAAEESRVLFQDLGILEDESCRGAAWHVKLLGNLLKLSAGKNLALSARMFCTSPKSVRGRLLSYLSQQAVRAGSNTFSVPFNRQQMADYLNVDRSALSKELGRMRDEGMLEFSRNRFVIKACLEG